MLATVARPTFPQTSFLPSEARPIGTAAGIVEDEQGGVQVSRHNRVAGPAARALLGRMGAPDWKVTWVTARR